MVALLSFVYHNDFLLFAPQKRFRSSIIGYSSFTRLLLSL